MSFSQKSRQISILSLASCLIISSARPAQSNPALVAAPAACATGVGCVLVGTAIVGGMLVYVWQNNQNNTTYHVPVYQARPKKPKVVPGQMGLDGSTITTLEECRRMHGKGFGWRGNGDLYGRDKNGNPYGICKKL